MLVAKTHKTTELQEDVSWHDITPGGNIYAEGNSEDYNTGDWRVNRPIWNEEKCKQCLLCFPVCPDSSIIIEDGKLTEFDMYHCKGCGVCAKTCPFDAIEMVEEGK